MKSTLAATFAAALVLLTCVDVARAQEKAAAPAAPQPAPRLAGRWELNAQQSDSPRGEVPVPGPEGRPGGLGGYGGYGGGAGATGATGGGYRGGGAGRGGWTPSAATREEMQRVLQASRVLLIVQDDTHISLTDEEGRVLSLKPDGTKVKELHAGASIERTTRWDDRSLVTTMKLPGGAKATQTFTKVSEGLQLVVATKIEGGGLARPIELKRVYDQAFQDPAPGR